MVAPPPPPYAGILCSETCFHTDDEECDEEVWFLDELVQAKTEANLAELEKNRRQQSSKKNLPSNKAKRQQQRH